MNRLELTKQIISEGKKRGIIVTSCDIYNRNEFLEFYITIKNENAKDWVYEFEVERLIADLAPLERKYKIGYINIDSRTFKVGEKVEVNNLWIKLEAGEKEPKIIKVSSGAGRWRQGWVRGKVVETPEQNDRAVVIKINRNIWYEEKSEWWGSVTGIENAIKDGKIVKIAKGQPVYIGSSRWELRKI